jgi:hypothetical protein
MVSRRWVGADLPLPGQTAADRAFSSRKPSCGMGRPDRSDDARISQTCRTQYDYRWRHVCWANLVERRNIYESKLDLVARRETVKVSLPFLIVVAVELS